MPDTERVQLPTGQTLVHQLNATEPRVYERLLLEYTKIVCLMFGVPNSEFRLVAATAVTLTPFVVQASSPIAGWARFPETLGSCSV